MFVTVERLAIALLFALVIGLAGLWALPRPNYHVQPSVPSLIPPPLSCSCGTSRQVNRPFEITCPYCRNAISVRPSATGELTGATILGSTPKKSAQ